MLTNYGYIHNYDYIHTVKRQQKAPTLLNLGGSSEGASVNHKPIRFMSTVQNYAPQHSVATSIEQVISLPLVSTGDFYAQLEILRNVYLLTKNPYMVAQNGRLLADEVRTLSYQLEILIEGLNPLIKEAIASHPIEAEHL